MVRHTTAIKQPYPLKGGAEVEDHVDPEGRVNDVVDGNVRRMLRNAERQLHRQVDRIVDDE